MFACDPDKDDSWTKWNNAFTAFDANAVTVDLAGYVFEALPAAFRRQMTVLAGLTSAKASFPVDKEPLGTGMDFRNYALGRWLGPEYFGVRSTFALRVNPGPKTYQRPSPRLWKLLDTEGGTCALDSLTQTAFSRTRDLL